MSRPTLKEAMTPGIRYVVKAGSRCQTFREGDTIWRNGDGSLTHYGWPGGRLSVGHWERFRVPIEVDRKHYEAVIQRAQAEINAARMALSYQVST